MSLQLIEALDGLIQPINAVCRRTIHPQQPTWDDDIGAFRF